MGKGQKAEPLATREGKSCADTGWVSVPVPKSGHPEYLVMIRARACEHEQDGEKQVVIAWAAHVYEVDPTTGIAEQTRDASGHCGCGDIVIACGPGQFVNCSNPLRPTCEEYFPKAGATPPA